MPAGQVAQQVEHTDLPTRVVREEDLLVREKDLHGVARYARSSEWWAAGCG